MQDVAKKNNRREKLLDTGIYQNNYHPGGVSLILS